MRPSRQTLGRPRQQGVTVETAKSGSLCRPAKRNRAGKSPQVTAVAPAENRESKNLSSEAGSRHGPSAARPAVTILDVRPMVPIASLPCGLSANSPAGSDEVRRLPPVESGRFRVQISGGETGRGRKYTATSTP